MFTFYLFHSNLMPMKHYVYYHIDPKNNQVKYVGKGSGYRAYEVNYRRSPKHLSWISELALEGLSVKIEIVERFESEKDAYKKEKELIAKLKSENVILLNTLPGGDPLCGPNNPMYGRKRPDKAEWNKSRKGLTSKQLYGNRAGDINASRGSKGSKNGMYGKNREDLADRNRSQAGKSYEDIYGQDKANEIRLKLGGIKILRNDGIVFHSIKSAAKAINTSKYLLNRHLAGHFNDINGYKFQYVNGIDGHPSQS